MTLRRVLTEGAQELGIELSDNQIDAFLVYLVELNRWNRKINLTAIREEKEVVIKHFLDSLAYGKGFDPMQSCSLLDMGSGAGFPGLPLKIAWPDLEITLVESVKKKAAFLRHLIRTLDLDGVDIQDIRTDELSAAYHHRFDVVTARAFADMKRALHEGAAFLKKGGLIVLSRGPEESIRTVEATAAGFEVRQTIEMHLPVSHEPRSIWVFVSSR